MNTGHLCASLIVPVIVGVFAACDFVGEIPGPEGQRPASVPEGSPECLSNEDYFAERVWPLVAARCKGCHTEGALAGETRMTFVDNTEPDWLDHNLSAMRAVSTEQIDGVPLLLVKPSGQHPDGHTGGEIFAEGTANYDKLALMAGRLRGEVDECGRGEGDNVVRPGTCGVDEPGPRALRLLTPFEFENTVGDLLLVEADIAADLTAGEVIDGFDNNVALTVSDLQVDQYREAAERLAADADLGPLVPCAINNGSTPCAREFVAEFGERAFRRPLTDEEAGRYEDLYVDVADVDGFEEGIRWVVIAMLQSPHFLYRAELGFDEGGSFRLTSWEIAAELSYLFWGTMPDAELRAEARSGALYDPEVVRAQALRLAADERSQRVLTRFADQWLGTALLPIVSRDAEIYPDLTNSVRDAMAREATLFIAELWSTGGTFEDLLLAEHTWVNAELAQYYGIDQGSGDATDDGFQRVDLSNDERGGGLLSLGALLTTHALPTNSSPIHRGKFVREQLLCQPLPPPPANLNTSPPQLDPSLTTRQRYTQHAEDPACHGCHNLIDPIGFAFEHFDGAGKYRADEDGKPIDAHGAIINSASSDAEFEGLRELSSALATSKEAESCYAEKWVRYGFGVSDTVPLDCYVERVTRGVASEGVSSLDKIVVALTATPHFTRRTGESGELDAPGADLAPRPGDVLDPGPAPDPDPIVDPDPDPGPDPDPDPDPVENPDADIQGDVSLLLTEQNRWNTGHCVDGVVRNISNAEVHWSVEVEVEGTISNNWNSLTNADAGRVTFVGESYNNVLGPGQETSFGYCTTF